MSQVQLDIDEFKAIYVQYATTPDIVIEWAFSLATKIIDNDEFSVVSDVVERKWIIYALMCHLLELRNRSQGGLAGPVTSATEGSVSIGSTPTQVIGSPWLNSTTCGQQVAFLMAPYTQGPIYAPQYYYHPWG